MYNGRQRHIQTESIQDQSAKEESVHGHRKWGESALRHVKNKVPSDKNKTLGRKRNVQGARTASARHEKEKSMQWYIWFHGCKLDCIHVTIAYAIR